MLGCLYISRKEFDPYRRWMRFDHFFSKNKNKNYKTIRTLLEEKFKNKYKWYRDSDAILIYLDDLPAPRRSERIAERGAPSSGALEPEPSGGALEPEPSGGALEP